MPAVLDASGFTLANLPRRREEQAIVRKELEPIARTELFGTVVKLGPHFADVQPSLSDSLPVIEVKGKTERRVHLRCD